MARSPVWHGHELSNYFHYRHWHLLLISAETKGQMIILTNSSLALGLTSKKFKSFFYWRPERFMQRIETLWSEELYIVCLSHSLLRFWSYCKAKTLSTLTVNLLTSVSLMWGLISFAPFTSMTLPKCWTAQKWEWNRCLKAKVSIHQFEFITRLSDLVICDPLCGSWCTF